MYAALFLQTLFNIAIAAIVQAIILRVSAKQVRFLGMVASKYLKLVASSNFWPLMLMFPPMSFVLLVIILLFFFFCADFHSIRPYSVYESVGKVLKVTVAAAHEIDVNGKS